MQEITQKVKPAKFINEKGREIKNIIGVQIIHDGFIVLTKGSIYTNVKRFIDRKNELLKFDKTKKVC